MVGHYKSIQIADDGEIFVALSQSPGFIRIFEGEKCSAALFFLPVYWILTMSTLSGASGTEILVTMDATPLWKRKEL